jgi:glutaredoxin
VRGELVLYSRARCGVCRRAEDTLARELRWMWPPRRPTLRIVDVDAAGLEDRYGVRVPVLTLDGVEISELELAPGTLRRALRERRRGA